MSELNLLHGSHGASEIETRIVRLGIALGINWGDETQVRELAREALYHSKEAMAQSAQHPGDYRQKAKVELFGVAALMMQLMTETAEEGLLTHGGDAWKSFSRALMHERGMENQNDSSSRK